MLWHQLIACAILVLALSQLHSASSQQSNGVVANSSSCAQNFTEVGDKCLMAVTQWLNWYEADRNCHAHGSSLVSVQNDSQLQLINKWLNLTAPYSSAFWTSGNNLGETSIYYWQSTGKQASYLPWASGQPQQAYNQCLTLSGNNYTGYSNYRLATAQCTQWAASVCEQKKYTTRVCLKLDAIEMAQVVGN